MFPSSLLLSNGITFFLGLQQLGPPEEADGVETRGKADVGCWRLCLTVCFCQYFLLFFFGPRGVELLD